MGSQALGSPAEAKSSANAEPVVGRRVRPNLRDPKTAAALFAVAWVLPVLTQLTRTDVLLVPLIVFCVGGLLRAGQSVLDRLMLTVALLIGTAMTAGLVFSLWPWGLQPVAIGIFSLNVLAGVYVWLNAPPPWRTWPRRVLGSDLVLAGFFLLSAAIAYGPSWGSDTGTRAAMAGMTGDRLRDFNLFDTIHRVGGFTFIKQAASQNALDPGMVAIYPPGGHYIYALADIFLRSNADPGNPVSELNRYFIWVCLGYAFFVVCVAWAARWVAGPSLAGWRRVALTTAICAFLATGAFTSAIWCTWDAQVFGMAVLALLAAVCFRPPAGIRAYVFLVASLVVAVTLSYELYAPFAAILVAVSAGVYRKRLLRHWKLILGVFVVAAPAALSEFAAANTSTAGLSVGTASAAAGFTIPFSALALVLIGVFAAVGFATSQARRRPSARAGAFASAVCGFGALGMMYYQDNYTSLHTTSYYFTKVVQAWVVITLVTVGTAGHLFASQKLKLPSRGWRGAVVGVGAFALAIVATNTYWWGSANWTAQNRPAVPANDPNPGASWSLPSGTTWATMWVRDNERPGTIAAVQNLLHLKMLGDHVPTLTIIFQGHGDNVNLSLQLAVLNRDAGLLTTPINAGMSYTDNLASVGMPGSGVPDWTPQLLQQLSQTEASIAASPVPVRVIVANPMLNEKLESWSAANPGKIRALDYLPKINDLRIPIAPAS